MTDWCINVTIGTSCRTGRYSPDILITAYRKVVHPSHISQQHIGLGTLATTYMIGWYTPVTIATAYRIWWCSVVTSAITYTTMLYPRHISNNINTQAVLVCVLMKMSPSVCNCQPALRAHPLFRVMLEIIKSDNYQGSLGS